MHILLTILYLLYLLYFFLAVGFDSFTLSFGWDVFSKILLVVFPVAVYAASKAKDEIQKMDYVAIFLPIAYWFVLAMIWGGKSGMNFMVVEPAMVMLITAGYFLKFLIPSKNGLNVTLTCVGVMLALTTIVYKVMPVLGD